MPGASILIWLIWVMPIKRDVSWETNLLPVPWNEYVRGKRKTLDRSDETFDAMSDGSDEIIASVEDLKVYYDHRTGSLKETLGFGTKRYVKAVDGISMKIRKGATFGIVGESGCGKSTLVKGGSWALKRSPTARQNSWVLIFQILFPSAPERSLKSCKWCFKTLILL